MTKKIDCVRDDPYCSVEAFRQQQLDPDDTSVDRIISEAIIKQYGSNDVSQTWELGCNNTDCLRKFLFTQYSDEVLNEGDSFLEELK